MLLTGSDGSGDRQHVKAHSDSQGRKPAVKSDSRAKSPRLSEGIQPPVMTVNVCCEKFFSLEFIPLSYAKLCEMCIAL